MLLLRSILFTDIPGLGDTLDKQSTTEIALLVHILSLLGTFLLILRAKFFYARHSSALWLEYTIYVL